LESYNTNIKKYLFNVCFQGRGVHRVLVGKPEGKNHWRDPDVDGRIILRWIFGKWEGVG